jgi:hypothetical protein
LLETQLHNGRRVMSTSSASIYQRSDPGNAKMNVDAEPLGSLQTQNSIRAMYVTKIAAIALLVLALGITAVQAVKRGGSPYVGLGASVSADVAVTARTFAAEGVWKLRGVPVNNNPPIGADDQYTHWPPLLPLLLSGCFRLFGASELTARLFMLCILFATVLLVARLGWLWLGPVGGALAGYFWLTIPVVGQFGDLVAQQSLAMFFVVGAFVVFYSGRERFGAALMFLAVLSSWESALVVPGVWLAARRLPELRRTAMLATFGAGTALACVMVVFTIGSPQVAVDTLQTVKYYMGLSSVYSRVIPNGLGEISFAQQIRYIIGNHIFMIGPLGFVAVAALLVRRPKDGVLLIYGLAAPWIVWTVVMRTHTAYHSFELLIGAPITALALAWVATADLRIRWSSGGVLKATAIVAVAAAWAILPHRAAGGDTNPESQIRYALDIRNSTAAGSVVLAPTLSAVPLYYSERHLIRGVANDAVLAGQLEDVRREFPASPIYLAIPPSAAASFGQTLSGASIVSSTADAIVARL